MVTQAFARAACSCHATALTACSGTRPGCPPVSWQRLAWLWPGSQLQTMSRLCPAWIGPLAEEHGPRPPAHGQASRAPPGRACAALLATAPRQAHQRAVRRVAMRTLRPPGARAPVRRRAPQARGAPTLAWPATPPRQPGSIGPEEPSPDRRGPSSTGFPRRRKHAPAMPARTGAPRSRRCRTRRKPPTQGVAAPPAGGCRAWQTGAALCCRGGPSGRRAFAVGFACPRVLERLDGSPRHCSSPTSSEISLWSPRCRCCRSLTILSFPPGLGAVRTSRHGCGLSSATSLRRGSDSARGRRACRPRGVCGAYDRPRPCLGRAWSHRPRSQPSIGCGSSNSSSAAGPSRCAAGRSRCTSSQCPQPPRWQPTARGTQAGSLLYKRGPPTPLCTRTVSASRCLLRQRAGAQSRRRLVAESSNAPLSRPHSAPAATPTPCRSGMCTLGCKLVSRVPNSCPTRLRVRLRRRQSRLSTRCPWDLGMSRRRCFGRRHESASIHRARPSDRSGRWDALQAAQRELAFRGAWRFATNLQRSQRGRTPTRPSHAWLRSPQGHKLGRSPRTLAPRPPCTGEPREAGVAAWPSLTPQPPSGPEPPHGAASDRLTVHAASNARGRGRSPELATGRAICGAAGGTG